MRIAVLGCGLVGGPIAEDLAKEPGFSVKVADLSSEALQRVKDRAPVDTAQADLRSAGEVRRIVEDCDMVVSAVPGSLGFATLRTLLEARKTVVDIAFFPEDPFELDELAKRNEVTAIVDCGVMPGMGSILAAHAANQLDETDEVVIYVGGLPVERQWPFEYKAVFSPADVIEEYVRPARFIEFGQIVTRPALSDPEYLEFPGVGTLEAFNTDGLRTMLTTISATNMKEKTLRYPGHIEKMAVFRKSGFFSTDEIEINGTRISPLEFTSRVLFPEWKLKEGEADLTVMKVLVRGRKGGEERSFEYDLLDRYDPESGVISMARTTGYTATAAVRMLRAGLYADKGVSAPEFLGRRPECVEFLLARLAERGVRYETTVG